MSGPGHPGGASTPDPADQLRDIRVQVLSIQKLIGYLGSGAYSYADFRAAASTNVKSIQDILPPLSDSEHSDAIADIQNTWRVMQASPILKPLVDGSQVPDAQTISSQIQVLNGLADHMIYLIGYLTIPARLNDWLSKAPTGYYVPFHQVFGDRYRTKTTGPTPAGDQLGPTYFARRAG